MIENAKPCPFCGGSNLALVEGGMDYHDTDNPESWAVWCECGIKTLKKLTITELKTSAVVMGVDPYQLRDRVEQDIASCYMGYGDLVVNNFGHIDYENRL